MATAVLRKEEALGLVLALAAHAGLVAWLVLRPLMPEPLPEPETMTVTLSDDIGLTATSPDPAAQPSPDTAPEIGEAPPPPQPVTPPEPEPVRKIEPRQVTPTRPITPPKQVTQVQRTRQPTGQKTGGSKLGDDFLKGVPNAPATGGASPYLPANQIGASVKSSLLVAISREIKPRWVAPQGAEVEKLETYVTWSLKPDGTLDGAPRVTRQEGITDANRAQAARHAEQAIRAVRLAAPFELPEQYYNVWKRVVDFRFDRRLSQ